MEKPIFSKPVLRILITGTFFSDSGSFRTTGEVRHREDSD